LFIRSATDGRCPAGLVLTATAKSSNADMAAARSVAVTGSDSERPAATDETITNQSATSPAKYTGGVGTSDGKTDRTRASISWSPK
jgi:hypothetical protein